MIRLLRSLLKPKPDPREVARRAILEALQSVDRARMIRQAGVAAIERELFWP
jgi:hypothetical protein